MHALLVLAALQLRRDRPDWAPGELQGGMLLLLTGSAIAFAVFRFVPRVPWPRPFRWQFVGVHLVAAPLAAIAWFAAFYPIASLTGWGVAELDGSQRFKEMTGIGCFFYCLVAGASYSSHGAARAARAEAIAAQTQLSALRSQLQPHFLFNALHTIVQLIHIDGRRAAEAAEMVADLLRRTLEEQRDEVPLRDEWAFVSRYLAVEQIRFGERLVVRGDLSADLQSEWVPSFAVQTLVENAVQHGAAPRVEPTTVTISGERRGSELVISVRNSGDGDAPRSDHHRHGHAARRDDNVGDTADDHALRARGNGAGTGLMRLRDRLLVLYGTAATLTTRPIADGGYEAVLTVPRDRSRSS